MTSYSPQNPVGDWEFKILRSSSRRFGKPEYLRDALEHEAQAGWELVEKFDECRLRLKRPTSRRQLDGKLDFDPYRTHVGMSDGSMAASIVGIALGIALALGLMGWFLARSRATPPEIPRAMDRPLLLAPAPTIARKASRQPPPKTLDSTPESLAPAGSGGAVR